MNEEFFATSGTRCKVRRQFSCILMRHVNGCVRLSRYQTIAFTPSPMVIMRLLWGLHCREKKLGHDFNCRFKLKSAWFLERSVHTRVLTSWLNCGQKSSYRIDWL